MTEERKRYLASISKEEKVIREALAEERQFVKYCKEKLDYFGGSEKTYKMITTAKSKIKTLKKQLPAPRKEINIGRYLTFFNCPICRTKITPVHAGYCLCCGQKFR